MKKVGNDTGRPLWFLLTGRYSDPDRVNRLMKGVAIGTKHDLIIAAKTRRS